MGTRRMRRKDGEFTLFFRKVSPFSNHHPAEFDCDGAINFEHEMKRFSCTEQYYMYNKASLMENRSLMQAVLESDNPKAMKSMCSKGAFRSWSDSIWNTHKESVMYRASLAKYRASRPLRYALFLTTGSRLVECSPFDLIWGIGKDLETVLENEATSLETGMNLLGKILDRVRQELWEDEMYRDERQQIENRLNEDQDYLLKALKHIDLMYKARAITRNLMSIGHASRDNQSYLTPDLLALLPEYAIPGPIEKHEPIRPSPPQFVQFKDGYDQEKRQLFESTPIRTSRRSLTPPGSRRLSGRLSITIDNRSNQRSIRRRRDSSRASTLTWERSRSRSRDRRSRSRSRSRDRKRRRYRSRSSSESESPPRKKSKSSKEHKKRQKRKRPHRHRSRSRSRSRSRRSESREARHRARKERKRERKERRRHRRRSTSSESSSRNEV